MYNYTEIKQEKKGEIKKKKVLMDCPIWLADKHFFFLRKIQDFRWA